MIENFSVFISLKAKFGSFKKASARQNFARIHCEVKSVSEFESS